MNAKKSYYSASDVGDLLRRLKQNPDAWLEVYETPLLRQLEERAQVAMDIAMVGRLRYELGFRAGRMAGRNEAERAAVIAEEATARAYSELERDNPRGASELLKAALLRQDCSYD